MDAFDIPLIARDPAPRRLAEFHGAPFHLLSDPKNKQASEQEMLDLLEQDVDLIILARYLQILRPEFVGHYLLRLINIHYSFLPAFVGAKPYHKAFERGVKLIGATSHYVTAGLDEGSDHPAGHRAPSPTATSSMIHRKNQADPEHEKGHFYVLSVNDGKKSVILRFGDPYTLCFVP